MTQPPSQDRHQEDEFPLYQPAPDPNAPSDNPAPYEPFHQPPVPPQSEQPRRSVGRRNLIIGAGAAVAFVGFARWRGLPGGGGRGEGSWAVPADTETFEIVMSTGEVTILPGDVWSAQWRGRERNEPEFSAADGTARIDGSTTDVTVHAPPGATVRIHTSTGDVTVGALALGALDIRTTTGEVAVTDAEINNVSIETTTGDVDLRLAEQPGRVTVETTTGGVEISLPGHDYLYNTDTRTGDVRIPDNGGSIPVDIRTTTGDIDVDET